MDIEAVVIEFKVPSENNKTLFIWDILLTLPEAFVSESICGVFAGFGALYLVKLCPAVAEPGFYAIVKNATLPLTEIESRNRPLKYVLRPPSETNRFIPTL